MLDVRSWILEPVTDPSSRPLEELLQKPSKMADPNWRLFRLVSYLATKRQIPSGMPEAG